MSKQSRRRYAPQFKQAMVELARRPGQRVAAVACEHGLSENMLWRWIQEAKSAEGGQVPPVKGGLAGAQGAERRSGVRGGPAAELVHLRRQVVRLSQERDFLADAAAYFARKGK